VRIGGSRGESQVEVGGRGNIEATVAPLGLDGLVNGALQAFFVHHKARPADRGHVPECELDVVWLGTRPGQARDRHEVAADLLGGELQRVERGDDREPAAHRAVRGDPRGSAGAQSERGDDEGDDREGGDTEASGRHVTDYQSQ
jgi:hypothetical protein